MQAARASLDRENPEHQLFGQPLAEVDDHDPVAAEYRQKRALEGPQREFDRRSRYRDATEGAEPSHPETKVTVAKPDLRQLDTDAGGDSLPHDRHFGSKGIAFTPEE